MLSFYEFDCILRKNKKAQRKEANCNEAFGQGFQDLLAKLAAHQQKTAAAAPTATAAPAAAPAGTAPVQVPPPAQEPDTAGIAPKAGAPRSSIVGGGAGKTTQQAAIKATQQPAKVNLGHDPNDPDSPQRQAAKAAGTAKDIGGRDSDLEMWNNMLRSGQVDGHSASTWSWALRTQLEKLGVEFPPELGKLEDGAHFQIAFAPGGSKQDRLPEVVIGPNTFKRASQAVWDTGFLGNEAPEEHETRVLDFDRKLKASAVMPNPADPQGKPIWNPEMKEVVDRAIQFSKIMFSDKHNSVITGKPMSIKQIVHQLNQISPMETEMDQKRRERAMGHATTSDQIAQHQRDPREIQHEREVGTEALIHMIKTDLGAPADERYGFFQLKSKGPLGPDSVVLIVPPDEMRNSPDPLGNEPVAGNAGIARPQQDAKTLAAKFKAMMTRNSKPQPPAAPPAAMESAGWMDVVELMEHWEF
jgi:hypothetical protein